MQNDKYNLAMRIIHWSLGAIFIALLVSGLTFDDWPKEWKKGYFFWHKSFGTLALILVAIRIIVRFRSKIPAMPSSISKPEQLLAKIGVVALYGFMIAMPFSGFFMAQFGGYPVPFFGATISDLVAVNKPIGKTLWEVHTTIPAAFAILVILHIIGSLKHVVIDKVNVIKRMW